MSDSDDSRCSWGHWPRAWIVLIWFCIAKGKGDPVRRIVGILHEFMRKK